MPHGALPRPTAWSWLGFAAGLIVFVLGFGAGSVATVFVILGADEGQGGPVSRRLGWGIVLAFMVWLLAVAPYAWRRVTGSAARVGLLVPHMVFVFLPVTLLF